MGYKAESAINAVVQVESNLRMVGSIVSYAGNSVPFEELKTNLMSLVIFISLLICSTCFGH